MINKKINLRKDDPDIYLTTYVSDLRGPARDAMLVIPGGGYYNVCADREGEPIALAYMNAGLNAFVLYMMQQAGHLGTVFVIFRIQCGQQQDISDVKDVHIQMITIIVIMNVKTLRIMAVGVMTMFKRFLTSIGVIKL